MLAAVRRALRVSVQTDGLWMFVVVIQRGVDVCTYTLRPKETALVTSSGQSSVPLPIVGVSSVHTSTAVVRAYRAARLHIMYLLCWAGDSVF